MQPVMVPYFSRLLILGKRNLRSWKILDDNIFLGYRTTLSAVLLHIVWKRLPITAMGNSLSFNFFKSKPNGDMKLL